MSKRKVSTQFLLSFLMMMFLMVIGCSKVEDAIKDALPIHKISGTVIDSNNAVMPGVTIKLTGKSNAETTTDSSGKYKFENLKNGEYTVTPSKTGCYFDPASKPVNISNGDGTANFKQTTVPLPFDGAASGTYTWDSGTNTLTFNWTNSDFGCSGPNLGSETQTGVTIGTTTMTWVNSDMTWTRSTSGAANDPAGTWTETDDNGNTYTVVLTATNSTAGMASVNGHIFTCGSDGGGTLSAGDYTATCSVSINSIPVSSTYTYEYHLPADAPISSTSSAVCSEVEAALSSNNSGCSNPTCSMIGTSSTSAELNLSCSVSESGITTTLNETCTMSK